jgi:DNA-binding Lrp family transcriptional regulator
MTRVFEADSVTLDRVDRQLIHALQLEPRAPFSRLAAALGVSEQTAARRYRQLRGNGVLRVIGVVNPRGLGESDWFVRVQCRPDGAEVLATALAQRDDVAWVSLSAGGSEIVGVVRSRTQREREELLLQRLPKTAQVLGISAFVMLHRFFRPGAADWMGLGDILDATQVAALQPTPRTISDAGESLALEPADLPMLGLLARDGRVSLAALANASGLSEGRVARRLAVLQSSDVLYFDLDVAVELVGFAATAYLWLTIAPARLDEVGREITQHQQVAFAAAITGSANLIVALVCHDLDELYHYVTEQIGAMDGVQSLEVSPILRRIKQAGALMNGRRLADLAPLSRAVSGRRAGR